MLTYRTLPSGLSMIQPPSFSANSQSILSQCCSANQEVLYCAPSSSASTRKMTSRFSGTFLGQTHNGFGENRDAAFEIDGAAAVQVAVFHQAGEWVDGPFVALDPDHVGMRGEQNRFLAAIAFSRAIRGVLPGSGVGNNVDFESQRLQLRS